jgi:hypothetical protein
LIDDIRLLFQTLIFLGVGCAMLDPVKDSLRLWELKYAILEDEVIEQRIGKHPAPAVLSVDLADALACIKAMSNEERGALRNRVIKPR